MKDRVRMALAEAGYPDATMGGSDDEPSVAIIPSPNCVPGAVCFRAFRVSGYRPMPCWPCWDHQGEPCEGGDCERATAPSEPAVR